MVTWSLQDAKARFSEAVRVCSETGTLMVTKHGEPAVVMLSMKEYTNLTRNTTTLKDFLLSAPRVDLMVSRERDLGRTVEV